MVDELNSCNVAVKRRNLAHHEIEAEIFERVHREAFSRYELKKAKENVECIVGYLSEKHLSIDVGCGTGFLVGFELPHFRYVVAADISRRMLERTKAKFKNSKNLLLLVCDAENLPFRDGVADLVTIASVLHHLPDPFSSILEMNRILRKKGAIFITREPNDIRYARIFDILQERLIHTLVNFITHCARAACALPIRRVDADEKLDYSKVDIHYPEGFNVNEISNFLLLKKFEVISAYSYHWLFPITQKRVIDNVVSKINLFIEKFPVSRRFGRHICILGKKGARMRVQTQIV